MASLPLLLLVLLAASPAEKSADTTRDLDVWLIPHSHCDTGWIETVDGYYNSSVKLILSTVTAHLDADPSARFIWSETLWLSMWWPQQTAPVQAAFRRIVERGQFEFVGAGWSQNDETTTHFRDVIDNQIIGHQWLQDTFGQQQGRTRWGWQIDMFAGYASTTPALWAMMEYDGMVIRWEGRDEAMQYAWTLAKDYQFHWHPSAVLSANRSSIFTHIINGNYGDLVPSNSYIAGYGCDANVVATGKCCADGPPSCEIVSAVNVSNVATVARTLVAQLRGKALPYRGPLMYPWGADFHFREAGHTFGNMSLVLAEIAAHPETYHTTVRLSTLSEYMDHLHSFELKFPEKNVTEASFEWGWPKVVHEHGLYPFNYSNESTQFQTGALTSQSVHKQHSRRVAVHTHAASAAHAVATAAAQHALNSTESRALLGKLVVARGALGICQHHDSMPGTMEPAVLADYTVRLNVQALRWRACCSSRFRCWEAAQPPLPRRHSITASSSSTHWCTIAPPSSTPPCPAYQRTAGRWSQTTALWPRSTMRSILASFTSSQASQHLATPTSTSFRAHLPAAERWQCRCRRTGHCRLRTRRCHWALMAGCWLLCSTSRALSRHKSFKSSQRTSMGSVERTS